MIDNNHVTAFQSDNFGWFVYRIFYHLKRNPIKVSYLTQCVKDYSSITLQRIVCHYIALRPYLGNQDPNNRPRSVTTLTQVPDSFIVLWVSKEHFQSIDPILFSLFNLELISESIYH